MSDRHGRRERLHLPTGDACNNRCVFCMEHPRVKGVTPDRDTALLQLEANRDAGDVIFTAGEPTLNPDLPGLMLRAGELGYAKICLVTNGRRLARREECEKLLDLGLNDICVSIHGPRADVHDAITGAPGSFEQTRAAIMNLSDLRLTRDFAFTLSTVLVKPNLAAFDDMLSVFFSLDADMATFKPPRVFGRSLENFDAVVAPLPAVAAAFKKSVRRFCRLFSTPVMASFVNLSGAPRCLLRGFEMFTGDDEVVLGLPAEGMRPRRIEAMTETAKRAECAKCVHDPVCGGVDVRYIERMGWDAFKPVRTVSAEMKRFESSPKPRIRGGDPGLGAAERAEIAADVARLREEAASGDKLKRAAAACGIASRCLRLNRPRPALLHYTRAVALAPKYAPAIAGLDAVWDFIGGGRREE